MNPDDTRCRLTIKGPADAVRAFVWKLNGSVTTWDQAQAVLAITDSGGASTQRILDMLSSGRVLTFSGHVPFPPGFSPSQARLSDDEVDALRGWLINEWGVIADAEGSRLLHSSPEHVEIAFHIPAPHAAPEEWFCNVCDADPGVDLTLESAYLVEQDGSRHYFNFVAHTRSADGEESVRAWPKLPLPPPAELFNVFGLTADQIIQ